MKRIIISLCFVLMHRVLAITDFVILIASYNNEKHCEWNIQTALDQDYSKDHYRIIFVDDNSTDQTLSLVKDVVKKAGKENLVTFIENNERKGSPVANHYCAIHNYVQDDEVIVILDGDDGLANNTVLSYLDKVYSKSKRKIWLTYGQYKELYSGHIGFNRPMPKDVVKNNNFRQWRHIPSHLRTFKAWLFKRIKKEDLMMNGEFVTMTGDMAAMIPMIEMARNHFKFIPAILYMYNDENPLSEHRINVQLQQEVDTYIRTLPVYKPLD